MLADKRGLRDPVVLVDVTADAALLRGMKRRNFRMLGVSSDESLSNGERRAIAELGQGPADGS